jgi:hypothetical protein
VLSLGVDEKLTCIEKVTLRTADGDPACLAFKTSTLFVGLGVAGLEAAQVRPVRVGLERVADERVHRTVGGGPAVAVLADHREGVGGAGAGEDPTTSVGSSSTQRLNGSGELISRRIRRDHAAH